jgi:hypothetical protein
MEFGEIVFYLIYMINKEKLIDLKNEIQRKNSNISNLKYGFDFLCNSVNNVQSIIIYKKAFN